MARREDKVSNNIRNNITVIIESAEEGGYFAYCPALKGCVAQGETIEETKRNMEGSLRLYISELVKDSFRNHIKSLMEKNNKKVALIENKEEEGIYLKKVSLPSPEKILTYAGV